MDEQTIAAQKGLLLFNGRGYGEWDRGRFYIAAKSIADAARMIEQAVGWNGGGKSSWGREIKTYYSKGCWGNSMDGIEPERGLWAAKDFQDKPVRVI